jgi:hypothetical protein
VLSIGSFSWLRPGHCGANTCLKIATDPTCWHREAYFGDLFRYVPGVIRVYESFAWIPPDKGRKPLYCLITEFAEGGDS